MVSSVATSANAAQAPGAGLPRWLLPRWESEAARRRRRAPAAVVALTVAAIGAAHVAWGWGSSWPLADPEQLVRTVVGERGLAALPPPLACFAVAGALFAVASGAVARVSEDPRARLAGHLVVRGAAAVFALRGVGGLALSLVAPGLATPEFAWWNLVLYSPLCLALAAGLVWISAGAARPA